METDQQKTETEQNGLDKTEQKVSSADSGLSNNEEDYSLISGGTSDFSLLEASSEKDDKKKKLGDQGSAFSEATGLNESGDEPLELKSRKQSGKKHLMTSTQRSGDDIEFENAASNFNGRKASTASSSTNDFSIIDLPDGELSTNDIEEDSDTKPSCEHLKIMPGASHQNDQLKLSSKQMISLNRPKEVYSHESSDLGSSFAVISPEKMTSSCSSSYDISIDRSRIQVLSTSMDEHKNKVIHGGITEVTVHREDWKERNYAQSDILPDETNSDKVKGENLKSIEPEKTAEEIVHNEAKEKASSTGSETPAVGTVKSEASSTGSETPAVGTVKSEASSTGSETPAVGPIKPEASSTGSETPAVGPIKSEKLESNTKDTEVENCNGKVVGIKKNITNDPSEMHEHHYTKIETDNFIASQISTNSEDGSMKREEIVDRNNWVQIKEDENRKCLDDKDMCKSHNVDDKETTCIKQEAENIPSNILDENKGNPSSDLDYSLVHKSELGEHGTSRHFGKSDIDSDIISSHSESHSRSSTSSSIELQMEEPDVEDAIEPLIIPKSTTSEDTDPEEKTSIKGKKEDNTIVNKDKKQFVELNKSDLNNVNEIHGDASNVDYINQNQDVKTDTRHNQDRQPSIENVHVPIEDGETGKKKNTNSNDVVVNIVGHNDQCHTSFGVDVENVTDDKRSKNLQDMSYDDCSIDLKKRQSSTLEREDAKALNDIKNDIANSDQSENGLTASLKDIKNDEANPNQSENGLTASPFDSENKYPENEKRNYKNNDELNKMHKEENDENNEFSLIEPDVEEDGEDGKDGTKPLNEQLENKEKSDLHGIQATAQDHQSKLEEKIISKNKADATIEITEDSDVDKTEVRKKNVKRFVNIKEQMVDLICQQKIDDLLYHSEKMAVEFDPTNLGFEVRGHTEDNVKEFCDYLKELDKIVTSPTEDQLTVVMSDTGQAELDTTIDFKKSCDQGIDSFIIVEAPKLDTDGKDGRNTDSIADQRPGDADNLKPFVTSSDGKSSDILMERKGSTSDRSTSGSDTQDSWQPAGIFIEYTEDEEKLSHCLKSHNNLEVVMRCFESKDKNRSHESTMKERVIQMDNILDWAKWGYVLSKEVSILKDRFPDCSFNFDGPYGKLDLIRYEQTEDELVLQQWYSDVIDVIKDQARKTYSCVISCPQQNIEMVLSQMEKICSTANLDVAIEHCQPGVEQTVDEILSKDIIVVTGNSHDVAKVLLINDNSLVKIYESQGDRLVSLVLCHFSLSSDEHNFMVNFAGVETLLTEFPGIYMDIKSDALKLLVSRTDVEQMKYFISEKLLKLRTISKMTLKPPEFSLLCRTAVKDYIVKNRLDLLGYSYRWTLLPQNGQIILYTESQEHADEIRDSIFTSFIEHTIKLDNFPMADIQNLDKWTEIEGDILNRSNGMANISLNDNQTVVTLIGTDDVMTAWKKFGHLTSLEKHLQDIVKTTKNLSSFGNEVKKFVMVDIEKHQQKIHEIQRICGSMQVELVQTDIGYEVTGKEETDVKFICDCLLQLSNEEDEMEQRRKVVKRFVQMKDQNIDLICQQKLADLNYYCKQHEVEFDVTTLGFEVRGKTEDDVKWFCDYLRELNEVVTKEIHEDFDVEKTEERSKIVKRFVNMKEQTVDLICQQKKDELDDHCKQLEVEFDLTNLGFEVKGNIEDNVKQFCDYLKELEKIVTSLKEDQLTMKMPSPGQAEHDTTVDFKKSYDKDIESFTLIEALKSETDGKDTKVIMEEACQVTQFVELDDSVVRFIDKFKMVELEEIMTNLEVKISHASLGYEVVGKSELNVNTLSDHLRNLNHQIETRKLEITSEIFQTEIQKLQERFKCIIKVHGDEDQTKYFDEEDKEDEAIWRINGIKVAVTVKDSEDLVCDVIISPMEEKQRETSQKLHTKKTFIYQEKCKSEEVNIPAPKWTDSIGKEKHEMTTLLIELLIELNNYATYHTVTLPVQGFNGWPPIELTKTFFSAFLDFCKEEEQYNIQKIILASSHPVVCQNVIEAVQEALAVFQTSKIAIGIVKKPRVLSTEPKSSSKARPEILFQPKTQDNTTDPQAVGPSQSIVIDNTSQLLDFHLKPEIIVLKGQIAQQEADAIVNTCSADFDLKNGAVSKSILEAAGKRLQTEIKQGCRGKELGDIVITAGYKLKCSSVFHGALTVFDAKQRNRYEQKSVKILEKFVMNCLVNAHLKKYRSIAFPALGTGGLDFPPDVVATVMLTMTDEFRRQHPDTTLTEVRIVIYRDEGMFFIFKKMAEGYREDLVKKMTAEIKPTSIKPPDPASVQAILNEEKTLVSPDLPTNGINLDLNGISLSAGLGDVTKLEGFDCLILLWPQDEISLTPIDKENILKSVGHSSLKQWQTDKDILSDSKIMVTPGGSLPQQKIIHVYVDNQRLQEAFIQGLTKAEELRMKSVVIPVRPTDLLAADVAKFSTCIFHSVMAMSTGEQFKFIKHVRVCIGGKHLCQPILATLAKLQETAGTKHELQKETTTCHIEITALKDDMDAIVAEIKPQTFVQKTIETLKELKEKDTKDEEVKNKTLTTEDAEQYLKEEVKNKTLTREDHEQCSKPSVQFLVNVRAEISCDIIDVIRGRNKLDSFKQIIESSSKQIKVVENDDGKWFIHGTSFEHVEICQKKIEEFWENLEKMAKPSETIDDVSHRKIIRVDIAKDLFQALMFLEKIKVTNIVSNAKIKFLESSGSLEITGQALNKDIEERIKKVISDFQSNITMDVIEIPYRQLREITLERFIIKLQTEYPDVYIYMGGGNGAESSFSVYLVSLNREHINSAKRGIQAEYLKTSNRAGRFSQSQIENKNASFAGGNNFNRSFSHQDRKPNPKQYQTAEGLKVSVYIADILNVPVDCIVNAANGGLMHGGGVAAVIARAAGRGFNTECHDYVKSYGEIKTGHCCVTNAGNLPYKRVIHAVGPQWSGAKADECCDLLQKTIEQCIQMANSHHMTSVAIPSISAGLYGMPAEFCARCYAIGVMTVSANRTGHWSLKEVHFIDSKPDMVFKVQAAFTDIFETRNTAKQRSLEEELQSYESVNQFRGDKTIINKLLTKDVMTTPLESGSTIVKPAVGTENNVRDQQPFFIINQSPTEPGNMTNNIELPATWHVTVRPNLLEVKTGANLNVLVYEQDFTKLCHEAVAFGQDTDYERRSTLVKLMASKSDIKTKLKQLKVQLPKPTVGTVAMFESIHDIYKQNVFVVFTPSYLGQDDPQVMRKFCDDLCRCYLKLFQEVLKTESVEFLAVSFLKTGNTGLKFEDGAEVFLQAVNTFTATKAPNCSLKQIHLVLNKKTSAFQYVQDVLEQHFKGQNHVLYVSEKVNKEELGLIGSQKKGTNVSEEAGAEKEFGEKSSDDTEIKAKSSDDTQIKAKSSVCAICLEEIHENDKKVLEKCKHEFCKDCIDQCFKHKPVCPSCGMAYGIVTGNQPFGKMKVEHHPTVHLPGFKKQGHYYISYSFQGGTQTAEHPNPGQHYIGTFRRAYLPANEKGTLVMELLKIAFDRKLVFTIGRSRTTGEENVVTWNDIHHKTNKDGGPQNFGYPDPEYLDRVLRELAAKGVTEADLKK